MTSPWQPALSAGRAWRTDVRYPQLVVDEATGLPVALFLDPGVATAVVLATRVLQQDLPGGCATEVGGLLRQGSRVPHHVYRQSGPEPDRRAFPDGDAPLGMFVNPRDAEWAVLAVRAQPTLRNVPRSPGGPGGHT